MQQFHTVSKWKENIDLAQSVSIASIALLASSHLFKFVVAHSR